MEVGKTKIKSLTQLSDCDTLIKVVKTMPKTAGAKSMLYSRLRRKRIT